MGSEESVFSCEGGNGGNAQLRILDGNRKCSDGKEPFPTFYRQSHPSLHFVPSPSPKPLFSCTLARFEIPLTPLTEANSPFCMIPNHFPLVTLDRAIPSFTLWGRITMEYSRCVLMRLLRNSKRRRYPREIFHDLGTESLP